MARDHTPINLLRLQSKIQWIGAVRLHQLKEDDESYLSEVEHPKGSGTMVYVCASTGLLFDKQSGRCFQSSSIDLLLDSVAEAKCSASQFEKWRKAKITTGTKHLTLKRGPKPKGQRAMSDIGFDEDAEME